MYPKTFAFCAKIFGSGQKIFDIADGTGISIKSQNWSKKFLKSPLFANFQDLKFLKAKFGIS